MRRGCWLAFLTLMVTTGSAHAAKCPQIHIVMDKSGSMSQQLASGQVKWKVMTDAIKTFTAKYEKSIRFGFEYFPGFPVFPKEMLGTTCKVPFGDQVNVYLGDLINCQPGCIQFGPKYGAAAEIAATITKLEKYGLKGPLGDTPTSETMGPLVSYAPLKDPAWDNYVLLVTDGVPNCSEMLDPSQPGGYGYAKSVAAIKGLADAGIPVFVLGVGTVPGPDAMGQPALNTTVLDKMAEAGGMPLQGGKFKFYAADNPTELTDALEAIAGKAGGGTVGGCFAGGGGAGGSNGGGNGGPGGSGQGGQGQDGQGGGEGADGESGGRGAATPGGCICSLDRTTDLGLPVLGILAAVGLAVFRRRRR